MKIATQVGNIENIPLLSTPCPSAIKEYTATQIGVLDDLPLLVAAVCRGASSSSSSNGLDSSLSSSGVSHKLATEVGVLDGLPLLMAHDPCCYGSSSSGSSSSGSSSSGSSGSSGSGSGSSGSGSGDVSGSSSKKSWSSVYYPNIPPPDCVPYPSLDYRQPAPGGGFGGPPVAGMGALKCMRVTFTSDGENTCDDAGVPANSTCNVVSMQLRSASYRAWTTGYSPEDPALGCFWSITAGGGTPGETCSARGYGLAMYYNLDGTFSFRAADPNIPYGGPPTISGIVPLSTSPVHIRFTYFTSDVACGGPANVTVDIVEEAC